jgi:hypothetical protein
MSTRIAPERRSKMSRSRTWDGRLGLMARHETKGDERWQSEIGDYLDRLIEAARASTLHAGAELRADTREMILYGVGVPDNALVTVMTDAPSNVRVVWREAPYTRTELSAEVERIVTQQPTRVNSGWPRTDGTGVDFTTTDPELLGAEDPQTALGARFRVRVEYGGSAIPA